MSEPDDGAALDFWSARPELKHVQDFARACRAGPWGTLGVVLARAIAVTEPSLRLPALIGGPGSLNMFVGLVGPSGGGKGTCEAAGRTAIEYVVAGADHTTVEIVTDELPLGSGEGLRAVYLTPGRKSKEDPEPDPERVRSRAILTASEIDTIAAIGARTGSTLFGELRKVYSGEPLGQQNAKLENRLIVPAHSYRAVAVVGIQPGRASALLDDVDGGTPQRFLWLPVSDPDAPEERDSHVAPLTVAVPRYPAPTSISAVAPTLIEVPEEARRQVDRHRLATLWETPDVDPLDGHRLQLQLKVAAGLAILAERPAGITVEDWELAGVVMAVSDQTRARVVRALAETARKTNRARALASAERDEVIADRMLERAKGTVLRALERRDEMTTGQLQSTAKGDLRNYIGAALADLAESGIVLEELAKRGGKRYRLTSTRGSSGPVVQ